MIEKQNSQQRKQFEDVHKQQKSCPSCSTNLELSDIFCPECGVKVSQVSSNCRVCGAFTSYDFCEDCGSSQNQIICQKCGTNTFGDFCDTCGEPITPTAIQFISESENLEELEILNEKEAEAILFDMESLLTPEVKRMQEKIRQRIILEREREYSQEREDRIKFYKGKNLPKIEIVSQEELHKIKSQMKNFSGYIERQIQKKEEEEREISRQLKLEEARIAEEKRKKKMNRVSGLWVSTLGDSVITLDLRDAQSGIGKAYVNNLIMETVDILKVNWKGSKIEFHTTKIHVKWILPLWERVKMRFTGHVSEDGEMMTGYLSSNEKWQEVFIKN